MKDTRQHGHLLFDLAVAVSLGAIGAPWWGMVLAFLLLRALAWLQRIFNLLNGLTTALLAVHITSSLDAEESDWDAHVAARTNGHDAS